MIYKYTKLNESFFENGMLRFTQPQKFNDPFEGQVNNIELFEKYKETDFFIPEMSNQILERGLNSRKIGVLSLSINKESLLMWAHYADEYKGMLLEFNPFVKLADNLIEFGANKLTLTRIEYNNGRMSGDYWGKIVENVPIALGIKNKQWEYEQEVRVFCHKDNIDNLICLKSEPLDEKKYNVLQSRDLLKKVIADEYGSCNELLVSAIRQIDEYINSNDEYSQEGIFYKNEDEIWLKKINKDSLNSIIIGPLADRWKALELYLRGVLSEVISGKTKLYFAVLNPSEYKLDYVEFSNTDKIMSILESEILFGSMIDTMLRLEFEKDDFNFDINDENLFVESESFDERTKRLLCPEYLSTYKKMTSI